MALDKQVKRVLLGEYIEQVDVRNTTLVYGEADVMGISIDKKFIPTKADLANVPLKNYKVVGKKCFAYSPVTSRNGERISIAFNVNEECIISSINPTFRVKDEKQLDSYYLMMFFKRPEFDRYARFHSWGSARETFSWEDMCNIEIPLPGIEVQREYVAVYKAMQHNLNAMQDKLDDLKLVCDAYIEELKHKYVVQKIQSYIEKKDYRNSDNAIKVVKSVSVKKEFNDTNAKVDKTHLENYKIVQPHEMSFVQTTGNEKCLCIALNSYNYPIVVTSVNEVFACNEQRLLPEFLHLFFNRPEFDRYARYHSWGSARETFTWEDMCDVKIPIPPIEVQKSIVAIYDVYNRRKQYAERLRQMINEMCPVLVAMTSPTPPKEGLSK